MADSAFETVPQCKFLDDIVQGASKSTELIEPWRHGSADHPVLTKYIGEIQSRHVEYCDAINMSVRTAQDGHDISRDAIMLCDYLRDKTQPRENIRAFILDMKEKAKGAHKECKETMEMFRSVNRGLIKVTQQIPNEVKQLTKARGGKMKTFFVHLVGGSRRQLEYEHTIKQLNQAAEAMVRLAENVQKFVDWWAKMEMHLSNTERDASRLDPEQPVVRLRIEAMKTNWTEIHGHHVQYKVKIIQLQDRNSSKPVSNGDGTDFGHKDRKDD